MLKIGLSEETIKDRIVSCLAAALEAKTDEEYVNCIKFALTYMELI